MTTGERLFLGPNGIESSAGGFLSRTALLDLVAPRTPAELPTLKNVDYALEHSPETALPLMQAALQHEKTTSEATAPLSATVHQLVLRAVALPLFTRAAGRPSGDVATVWYDNARVLDRYLDKSGGPIRRGVLDLTITQLLHRRVYGDRDDGVMALPIASDDDKTSSFRLHHPAGPQPDTIMTIVPSGTRQLNDTDNHVYVSAKDIVGTGHPGALDALAEALVAELSTEGTAEDPRITTAYHNLMAKISPR